MARTYNNPPLIEAVCAFTFKNAQPWDLTIPGLVYEQIRDKFPVKEQGNMLQLHDIQSLDQIKLDNEPETDIWVDMPPCSTRKVEMQAQYAGRGEPLPFSM